MKIRIFSVILIISLCIAMSINVNANNKICSAAVEELYNLGIIEQQDIDNTSFITKAETVKYIIGMLGLKDIAKEGAETIYGDVPAEHWASGYIKFAYDFGIVSANPIFHPEGAVLFEQAVKMLVVLLGYEKQAEARGGYPLGYIITASDIGLLKGFDARVSDRLNINGIACLLRNALTVPIPETNIIVSKTGERYFTYNKEKGKNLLYKNLGISIYKVVITEYKEAQNKIKADIISFDNNNTGGELEVGESTFFELSGKIEADDYKYVYAEIWVNRNKAVLNIKVDKDIEIKYGYIDEIDGIHAEASKHDPRYIKNVALLGSKDYIDISHDCNFYYNYKSAVMGGISFIGSYSRLVVYKDEIISFEAWGLKEGGIVTKSDFHIEYFQGGRENLMINGIGEFENTEIIINGEKNEYYALIPGMLFDYYIDDDEKNLLMVASTKVLTDVLNSVSDEYAEIGGIYYSISKNYNVFCSADGIKYNTNNNLYDFIGKTVTIHIDNAGFVRCAATTFDEEESLEFYGLVSGFQKNNLKNDQLRLFRIYSDRLTEKVYELNKRVITENNTVINSIKDEIHKIQSNNETNKNDVIKNANVLYKFKINEKNQIISIKKPNLFDMSPETGISVTAFTNSQTPYLSSPRIYFHDAQICAFYYEDGIKAKLASWNDLRSKSSSNIRIDFYSEEDGSDIELVLVRGNVNTISLGRAENIKYGLITNKTKIFSENGYEQINIEIGSKKYIVEKEMVAAMDRYAYIAYGEDAVFSSKNDIYIQNLCALDGDPLNWDVAGGTQVGLHKGIVTKIDNRRMFFDDNTRYYMGDKIEFYEVSSEGRFYKCELYDVNIGVPIWYFYHNSEIRAAFFISI